MDVNYRRQLDSSEDVGEYEEPCWVCCDSFFCEAVCKYYISYIALAVACFMAGVALVHSIFGAILAMLIPGCAVLMTLYNNNQSILHQKLFWLWGFDIILFLIAWQLCGFMMFSALEQLGLSTKKILGEEFENAPKDAECSIDPEQVGFMVLSAFVLAALVEETLKYILSNHISKSPYIVSRKCVPLYAIAFCMFFGMYENVGYIMAAAASGSTSAFSVSLMRGLLPMHPFWGCISASYHEQARYLKCTQPTWWSCIWRSVLLHGLFDFCAFSAAYAVAQNCFAIAFFAVIVECLVIIFSFILVRKGLTPLWQADDEINVHYLIANRQLPEPEVMFQCFFCVAHEQRRRQLHDRNAPPLSARPPRQEPHQMDLQSMVHQNQTAYGVSNQHNLPIPPPAQGDHTSERIDPMFVANSNDWSQEHERESNSEKGQESADTTL